MILVVPATEAGRGGGHLVRCTKLASELQETGKEVILYDSANYKDLNKLNIELIILDRFQTPKEELEKWKEFAPVIGIDEGGKCRDEFDFLIDILPNLESEKANISDISLLPLPQIPLTERTETRRAQKKILISFGLEDSAGTGQIVFDSLSKEKNGNLEITFLNNENRIENLAERLHEYDLLVTHFGITVFEAIYSGIPFALINPTSYHEKLSGKAGFKTTTKKLRSRTKGTMCFCELRINKIPKFTSKSLAKLISSFSPQIHRTCPVCGETPPARSLARFPEMTYRKCKKCGIIYMDRITQAPVSYGKEYFTEDYQKQYGKTYLEDFPNLKKEAKRRLNIIKKIMEAGSRERGKDKTSKSNPCSPFPVPHLLDIGCAYGAFLSSAKEEGFKPYGIDPCKEAVDYVNKDLEIPAICGFFPDLALPTENSRFNVITLWYTIEHFQNCIPVLKKIRALLAPNGIFAFSTPSFKGISGRKNIKKYLQNSPRDHYTIWSPESCKKALSVSGFKVIKVFNTGHHPERFPLTGNLAGCKLSPFYWFLLAISKIFRLGDTFEVYARLNTV